MSSSEIITVKIRTPRLYQDKVLGDRVDPNQDGMVYNFNTQDDDVYDQMKRCGQAHGLDLRKLSKIDIPRNASLLQDLTLEDATKQYLKTLCSHYGISHTQSGKILPADNLAKKIRSCLPDPTPAQVGPRSRQHKVPNKPTTTSLTRLSPNNSPRRITRSIRRNHSLSIHVPPPQVQHSPRSPPQPAPSHHPKPIPQSPLPSSTLSANATAYPNLSLLPGITSTGLVSESTIPQDTIYYRPVTLNSDGQPSIAAARFSILKSPAFVDSHLTPPAQHLSVKSPSTPGQGDLETGPSALDSPSSQSDTDKVGPLQALLSRPTSHSPPASSIPSAPAYELSHPSPPEFTADAQWMYVTESSQGHTGRPASEHGELRDLIDQYFNTLQTELHLVREQLGRCLTTHAAIAQEINISKAAQHEISLRKSAEHELELNKVINDQKNFYESKIEKLTVAQKREKQSLKLEHEANILRNRQAAEERLRQGHKLELETVRFELQEAHAHQLQGQRREHLDELLDQFNTHVERYDTYLDTLIERATEQAQRSDVFLSRIDKILEKLEQFDAQVHPHPALSLQHVYPPQNGRTATSHSPQAPIPTPGLGRKALGQHHQYTTNVPSPLSSNIPFSSESVPAHPSRLQSHPPSVRRLSSHRPPPTTPSTPISIVLSPSTSRSKLPAALPRPSLTIRQQLDHSDSPHTISIEVSPGHGDQMIEREVTTIIKSLPIIQKALLKELHASNHHIQ